MRRILVVANRTLGQDSLLEAITYRVAEGPCEFTLIVPATAPTEGDSRGESSQDVAWPGTARQAGDFVLPERSYDQAQQRLEYGLERFRRVGAVWCGIDEWSIRSGETNERITCLLLARGAPQVTI